MVAVTPMLPLFMGVIFHQSASDKPEKNKKVCKVVEEVMNALTIGLILLLTCTEQVRFRENYAYSGQLVRVVTTEVRYEVCTERKPNCCRAEGCCDERGTKMLMVIIVAVFSSVLCLAFLGVCFYSACCNRKQSSKGEVKEVEEDVTRMAPRYDMNTYLTAAGFDPSSIPQHGQPRSAIQPSEYKSEDTSDSSD